MSDGKLLSIYSASAGSGKTYILALNYIKLLIDDPKNYQHILAVTFTNKATAEMKERIISFLSLLSSEQSEARAKKQKANMISVLRSRGVTKNEAEISKICGEALLYILNDYSQFNISTIDAFVQRVIRAFAFEAHLPSSLGVDLDQDTRLEKAVDELMASLKNDESLRSLMHNCIREKISTNEKWTSLETSLKNLGRHLFLGTNNEGLISNLDAFDIKRQVLKKIVAGFQNEMIAYANKIADVFDKENIRENTEQLNNGKRSLIISILQVANKSKSDYLEYVLDRKDKLVGYQVFKSEFKKNVIVASEEARALVQKLTDDFSDFVQNNATDCQTAMSVLKDFDSVLLLSFLDKCIKNISKIENKYPISDYGRLLNKLIDNSSVPFIYEKTGTRIFNMMIDEFQDTSVEQWANFKPLVRECLDRGNESMLVGDVKQAIYRWRGSDWQLLHSNVPADTELKPFIRIENLDKNWRSLPNVVNFNNLFFSEICKHISDSYYAKYQTDGSIFTKIFETVAQQPQRGNDSTGDSQKGFVRLRTISYSKSIGEVRVDIASEVVEQIKKLIDNGLEYSDICILIRSKTDSADLVPTLVAANIPFVSNDVLMLFNSVAVKMLEAYMKLLVSPSDKQSLTTIIAALRCDGKMFDWEAEKQLILNKIRQYKGLGLIELTFKLIENLPEYLYNSQYAYIESFADMVQQFTTNRHANLTDLLEYFEQVRNTMAIVSPENQNAVTIMTIHKAKGLEYKAVLVPYANWVFLPKASNNIYVWLDEKNRIPDQFMITNPMPFKYTEKALSTYARQAVIEEITSTMVDNLNLLYVAFTRAKEVLMVWAPFEKMKNETIDSDGSVVNLNSETETSRFIYRTISKLKSQNNSELTFEIEDQPNAENPVPADESAENVKDAKPSECVTYTIGSLPNYIGKSKEADGTQTFEIKPYRVYPWNERIEIHHESEKDRFESLNSIINYGNVMHGIMERVIVADDVENAVNEAVAAGDINIATATNLKKELVGKLSGDNVARWFDGSMKTVYTEDVIAAANVEKRPDRIMLDANGNAIVVDYKFGKTKQDKYASQVRDYLHLLLRAGFTSAKGFLWYYAVDEVVEVSA